MGFDCSSSSWPWPLLVVVGVDGEQQPFDYLMLVFERDEEVARPVAGAGLEGHIDHLVLLPRCYAGGAEALFLEAPPEVLEEVQGVGHDGTSTRGEGDVGAGVPGPHVGDGAGARGSVRAVEKKRRRTMGQELASSSLEGASTGPWLDWVYAVDDVVESLTVVFPLADDSLRVSGFDSFVSSPPYCCMVLRLDFEISVLFSIVFSTSTPLSACPPLVVSIVSLPFLILRETSGHRLMLNFPPTLIFPLPTPPLPQILPLPLSRPLY